MLFPGPEALHLGLLVCDLSRVFLRTEVDFFRLEISRHIVRSYLTLTFISVPRPCWLWGEFRMCFDLLDRVRDNLQPSGFSVPVE